MTAIRQRPAAPEAARTDLPPASVAPQTAQTAQAAQAGQIGPPPAPEVAQIGPSSGRGYARVKRVLDALLAGAALVVLAPVIACVWAAVLVRLGRPALFLQERVTLDGRRFRLGKFRTMLPVDPDRDWVTDEQRLTPFGSWLRATSLDELPSLWNILIGDMSIVGPRPLPSRYLSIYSGDQHDRHSVRAGLTGLAQVSGRNNVPWDARLELDQRYVLLMGPLLDLMIVARTVTTVLSREGVVEGDLATSTEFPGPYRTPRVRFVPHGASAWTALTPEDRQIAACELLEREHPVTGEACAELSITWTGEQPDREHIADVLTLLVSRARGEDCTIARISLPHGAPVLSRTFREAGFHSTDDSAVLTADIRCLDDPIPRGAGR